MTKINYRIKAVALRFIVFLGLLTGFMMQILHANPVDSTDTDSSFYFMPDDPWAYILDSSLHLLFYEQDLFTADQNILNTEGFDEGNVPSYPDSFYVEAFQALHAVSPMEYKYNDDVSRFIDLYTKRRRTHLSNVLALSQVYFPLFEEYLDQYGLPKELKYLAVIESALNPLAISRAGAGGLWQFMPATGRIYGLNRNTWYDERSDPHLATEAACKHLSRLYAMYGDWLLAIAAYNSGSGNVNKAIRRSGGKNTFWEISPYLPRETRGYVPAFVAVSFAMQNPGLFNIYPKTPAWKAYEIDTIMLSFPVSFRVLSDSLGIPAADLSLLNPAYLRGYIPASIEEPRILRLPLNYCGIFASNEQMLRNFHSSGRMEDVYGNKLYTSNYRQTVHVVRSGESLGVIARKYGTSVSKIKSLNRLRGTMIHPGQRLVVSTPLPSEPKAAMTGESRLVFHPGYEYHIAHDGESLESIAMKYEDIDIDDLIRLNKIPTDRILDTGCKIRLRIRKA